MLLLNKIASHSSRKIDGATGVLLQHEPQLCQAIGASCATHPRDVMCSTSIEASRRLQQVKSPSVLPLGLWDSAASKSYQTKLGYGTRGHRAKLASYTATPHCCKEILGGIAEIILAQFWFAVAILAFHRPKNRIIEKINTEIIGQEIERDVEFRNE